MQKPILSLFVLCLLVSLQGFASAQEAIDCPDAPPTRLENFVDAAVTPGQSNHLRARPSTDSEVIGELPAGTVVNVLNDHECADGYLWWEVAYNGIIGYTAEGEGDTYWLEPYVAPTPMPASTATDAENVVQTDLLTFTFSPDLAESVTMQPRTGYMVRDAMSPRPHHVSYNFERYVAGEPGHEYSLHANIEIYPLAAWEALYSDPIDRIPELRALLNTRRPIPASGEEIPVLPYRNAAQFFAAQAQYLEFEDGAGVRFVTYYAQNTVEITGDLFYTFQGITDDGVYYISADFPLIVPPSVFPPFDEEAAFSSIDEGPVNDYIREYVAELAANIDALAPSEFTPDLSMLDAMIESMQVNTDVAVFPESQP
jgi:hypothetical protein